MVKNVLILTVAMVVTLSIVFVSGCGSSAGTGGLLGGAIGAGVGQLAGGDTKSTLIGAGVGAGAGYIVGNEMDKKKAAKERENLQAQQNIVTIWITNNNSSQIPITLTKSGPGYVGPKNEYYPQLPTQEQLKMLYGS